MGIHYDYKSKRGERAMLKEAKRKARLAQRRAKKMLSSSSQEKEEPKTFPEKCARVPPPGATRFKCD